MRYLSRSRPQSVNKSTEIERTILAHVSNRHVNQTSKFHDSI